MSARAAMLAAALLAAAPSLAQSPAPDPTEEAGRINARLAMEYLKRGQLQVAQEKIEKAYVKLLASSSESTSPALLLIAK